MCTSLEKISHKKKENVHRKDIIVTIEVLNGKDDCGVEYFIKIVKKAHKRCCQKDLLLDLILSQKVIDQAKRAIRFIPIEDYEDLYHALRQNVVISSSVELSRSKLDGVKQSNSESVQGYNMRFRQQFNAVNYAIQNKHSNSTAKRLALRKEERSTIKKYIINLKDEIASQVRPLRPATLNQAMQDALELEIWCIERNQVRMKPQHNAGTRPHTQ